MASEERKKMINERIVVAIVDVLVVVRVMSLFTCCKCLYSDNGAVINGVISLWIEGN